MSNHLGLSRSPRSIRGLWFALVLLATTAFPLAAAATEPARPSTWATAVEGVSGMANLFRVSPQLFRSEQPTAEALQRLLGGQAFAAGDDPVRTVVSLRAFHDIDGDVLGKADTVHYERIKMYTWHPEDAEVVAFLRIVMTPSLQPVLVHCAHGADRTGMMVAIYRIVAQGWSKEDALKEMTSGGYGFHPIWGDLVAYIQHLDVDKIKAQVAQLGPWPARAGA